MRALAIAVLLLTATNVLAAAAKRFPVYQFTPSQTAAEYAAEGRMELDAEGVAVFDYGTASDLGAIGRRYNPTFIATYALVLYRDFLAGGDPSLRVKLLKNVDWLLEHRQEAVHQGVPFWRWPFDFDYPYFGAKAPWYSALAQARILAAFAQAYSLTGDGKYKRAAGLAFGAFVVPMRDGGLATFDGDVVWLEEIAGPSVPSTKILNGHISALAALRQYAVWSGDAEAARLVSMAVRAVRRDLPRYDASFLSWYAQEPGPERKLAPTRNYNVLHIKQLFWLYETTRDPLFLDYALRFGRYEEPGLTLSAAGSTDPVRHGPEGMRFRLGNEYWSHNQFPTWVQADLGAPRRVRSVVAVARTAKSAPRHYEVLLSVDGEQWERVAARDGNGDVRMLHTLEVPKRARYVRMRILSDNGNRNVALTGFTAVADDVPAAVADTALWMEDSPAGEAFKSDWPVRRGGSVIVDLTAPGALELEMRGGGAKGVTASGSNDLRDFAPVKIIAQERSAVIPKSRYRYLRITFPEAAAKRTVRFRERPR